jgi:hypothetical protein
LGRRRRFDKTADTPIALYSGVFLGETKKKNKKDQR